VVLETFLRNTDGAWLGTRTNHRLNFYTNNTFPLLSPSMAILTNGNVCIGGTLTNFKLDVNGNSRVIGTLQINNGTQQNHAVTLSQLDAIENKFDTFNTLNTTRTITYAETLSVDTGGGVFTQHTLSSRKIGVGTYNVSISINPFSSIATIFSQQLRWFIEVYRKGSTPGGTDKCLLPFQVADPNTTYSGGIITNGTLRTITMPFTYSVSQTDINNNNNEIEVKIRPNPLVNQPGHEIIFDCKITTERVATSDWS
jgi:hypothetical protein